MGETTRNYLSGLKEAIDNLPLGKIDEVIDLMLKAYDGNRQIFIFGNGGSGSTASHFACDINKGVSLHLKKRFRVICLNDNLPVVLAYANDLSYEDIFVEQLKNFLNPSDVVIGISGIACTSLIVPSNDMQKVEDLHLVLVHIIMQILDSKLSNNTR